MSSIVKMYDASNNDVYPITHLRAVRDSNGTTLESMIQGVNETTVGYYECTTAGSTPEKTITIDSSVSLSVRISCKVKFAEKNTGANATMNINNTGAKPLFYNGVRAAANNSWYTNEIVDLYFDGTNYQAKSCSDTLEYDVSLHQTHEITEVTTTTRTVVYNGDVTSGWENETSVSDSSVNGYTRTETNTGKDNDTTTVDGPTAKYDTASNKTSVVYVTKRTLTHVVNDYTFDEAVNAVPMSYRHGGLKLRFISNSNGSVQNSDNKYVQYRLMKNTWSTTVSDWQGVDDEPVVGSENLVKSGGVADSINQLKNAGYLYAGIATPTTNPGTPDVPVFYIANGKGTYTNFGGIDVTEDEVVVLYYDTVWHKNITGIASNDKLTELAKYVKGVELSVTTPMAISLGGGAGTTVPSPSSAAGWGYYDAECVEGAKITVSGNGGNFGLWGFVDANGIILSWSGTNARETDKEIIAPANTARVIINTYNPGNYPSPKMILPTSLIGQIDALVVKTNKTNYNVGKLLTEKEVSPVFATGYITGSGGISTNSSYKYGIFDAEAGDIIIVNFEYISGAISVISVQYPELSTISPKVLASSGQTEYQYLCTEDCKIVISGLSASLTYKVIHSRIDEQIQDSGLPTAIQRVFPDFTINNGSYWNVSGSIASLGGWIRSSGAFLKKGTVISLYWEGLNNRYVSIITEVNEQDEFLRACLLAPNTNIAGDLKFVVDKDGYYAISNSISVFYRYQIIYFANGDLFFNPPLDHLFLPTQDGLPREILRSPSFVGIIHKWGFIGDSLSSGEQAVHEDGTSTLKRFDLYDYSWGQRLCKLNSVEGFNFSVGGQTTKGWCNGADERTWAGAQLQENWKEAYCIALGVNDNSASYPKGDVDTDIDLSNYNNNADTFAGWYAGIIQRLRSVNPKCRIFCITIPYNNKQGYLDNNEVIRAIVPKFSRCYLVDLANYHWTPDGLGLNDHLSPAGYQWAAFEINTYIDWIIRNNMDDFKDIAWVGTEYSA